MRSKLLTSCLLAGIAVALVVSAARREQQHVAPPLQSGTGHSAADVAPPSSAAQHVAPLSQSGTAARLAGLKAGPTSDAATRVRLVESYGKLPLSFEANQGQTDPQVKFVSRGRGYALFLTGDEAVLALRSASQESSPSRPGRGVESRKGKLENGKWKLETGKSKFENRNWKLETADLPGFNRQSSIFNRQSLLPTPDSLLPIPDSPAPSVLRLRLVGANPSAKVAGLDELPGKSNYFLGNDPKKWRTNVSNYGKVRYKDVYPGIDLVYYGHQGQLEYDWVVAPGADPRMIALSINGADNLEIDTQGDLVFHTDGGDIRLHKPLVYQATTNNGPRTTGSSLNCQSSIDNRQFLNGPYTLRPKNEVGFEVAGYDRTRPLIIDPVLVYSTYLGGSSGDRGYGIAVDSAGNAYVTGETDSPNFPTANPFQAALAGSYNAFVTKLNAAGSALVYSTYLGGSNWDQGNGIAVDSAGNAYVTGFTASTDFPTVSPLQAAIGGGTCGASPCPDAFVTKLNAAGSALVYSTYLGGSGDDEGYGIAVNSAGNAYVTGYTASTDFPTANPFQAALAGGGDAFVTKLNAAGSALVYSTYLGGSGVDGGSGIAVDSAGNAYVTGGTWSADFPTANPFQGSLAPGYCEHRIGRGYQCSDGFATKLNAAGSALVYSTYLGGKSDDWGYGIAVDSSGNAYVTGSTQSSDFPTTSGAFDTACGTDGDCNSTGGFPYHYYSDAFVTKLDAAGSALVYSTYLGGSASDGGNGIAVDSAGNAYVTGVTPSMDFPTANPIETASAGAFVSKLNASGSALVYSTYLGGSGGGIAVDPAGNAYVTGSTGADAFVAKISPADAPAAGLSPGSLVFTSRTLGSTSAAQTVTLHDYGSAPLTISGISTSGDFAQSNNCDGSVAAGGACTISVTFTPTGTGTRTGTLAVADNAAGSPQTVGLSGTGISPVVTLSATSLAFGNQPVGTTSDAQSVTLTNTGIGPLTITSIATSADFAQTNTCGSSVAQGAQCTISVTFTPAAAGARTGSVTISDNGPGSPQTVRLTGVGIPPTIALSPTALTFGDQRVGTKSAAQTVTLTNDGPGPLKITSLSASGDYAQTNNCPGSLAASANCTISVAFTPTATGTRSGKVTINDNATGNPHLVTLTGTGTAPAVTLSPTGLSFPDQSVGTTSAPQAVTLTNSGTATLNITSIVPTLPFAQTNGCGSSLGAGASCAIGVSFTPTVTGTTYGALLVTDDATGSPQTVSLTGTGIMGAVATLSRSNLNFGGQLLGTPSTVQMVILTNTGNINLTFTSITASGDFAQTNTCGSSVAAGASCTITATFTPAALGTRTGTITITDNAYAGSVQKIALTGVGVALGASPVRLLFPRQAVGTTSRPQAVTLRNALSTPLTLTSTSVRGDFSQTNNCGGAISARGSCTVRVVFTPTASGIRNGFLSITNGADGRSSSVILMGIGLPRTRNAGKPISP